MREYEAKNGECRCTVVEMWLADQVVHIHQNHEFQRVPESQSELVLVCLECGGSLPRGSMW